MSELTVKNVSKSFDGKKIIQNIDLTLHQGELVSILGVSGGGKTTLFNVISGLTKPDEGQVFLDGEEITGKPGRISYMLQKDLLLPYRTIEDNVALPLLIRGMKKKEARAQAAPYFEEFGLEGTQKKYPRQLSGGMRQRAALMRTYMFSRNVALLDEPFPLWTRSPRAVCIPGIWISWKRSDCPHSLLPMISTRQFSFRTGYAF